MQTLEHQHKSEEAEPGSPQPPDPKELARWQRLVLPVMIFAVVGAGIFFAVAIVQEIRTIYPRLEQAPASLAPQFDSFEARRPDLSDEFGYLRFKTLALLEADALQRRYQQANAAMLSRVWTRQMGFLTGMLMALIGSAFILGRIEVRQTTLSAERQGPETAGGTAKAALATTSPGIVLATLGTALMAMTISVPGRIDTTDSPVYLRPLVLTDIEGGTEGPVSLPVPPPLPEGAAPGEN